MSALNAEAFSHLHLGGLKMATTRSMDTGGRHGAKIISRRPGEPNLEYTLDIEPDETGYADDRGERVAWRTMNKPTRIDVNSVERKGRKLILHLREQVKVTITRRGSHQETKCDCPNWEQRSACSVRLIRQ